MIPHRSGWLRRFFIAAVLTASAVPLAAQCSQQTTTGPYTISPSFPPIRVRTLTFTLTRGKVITTYTITGYTGENNQPSVQIKENGQPLTYDPSQNPLGVYSQASAADFIENLINECNNIGAQFAPISHPLLRPDAISSATAAFGQTANVYVSADFNNDGVPDNATAGDGSVQITLYNQTAGALTPKNIAIGGSISTGIVAADFNGDGNTDLAVTVFNASGNGSVVVLLGNGDGTFKTPGNYTVGAQPLSLAAVDLNGDGKPDLVVANSNANDNAGTIDVLLGNGDGTFAAPVVYNVGEIPQGIVAVDLNGDGHPDVALVDAEPAHDQLLVVLNNGAGTLRAPLPAIATGTGLGQLSYTDLNHDGKLDLLIADQRGSDLTVLMGNGDGTFQSPKAYAYLGNPASVAVVPMTDGSTALLSEDAVDGAVQIMFADSAGHIGSSPIQALGTTLSAVAAADLNLDGKPDIVVTDQGGNRIYVMLNSGNYQFANPVPYALNASPSATAIADVNGDGKPDLVIADTNGIDVLPGKGDGTFGAPQTTAVSGASAGIIGPVVADFNGDGKLDALIAVGGQASFFAGQGNGTFTAGTAVTNVGGQVNPVALVTGNFNGDGKPDFAFAYGVTVGTTYSGFLAIELSNGNGTFRSATIQLAAGPVSLAVGDVNKDGRADLIAGLVTNSGPQLAVFLGKGDGTFQNPTAIVTAAYLPSIAVVDFNGDGNPDLLLGDCCGLSEAVIMLGNGDGTFQTGTAFLSGPNPTYLAVADFDGDGKPDLAIAGRNNAGATLVVLRNATPSVAKAAVVSSANPNATAIAPNSLADAYGSDLANSQPASTSPPLPTSFGGTTVSIYDSSGATSAAPLLYVSSSQVNFLVPSSVATGAATVTITSGDGTQAAAAVTVAPVAPGVFTLNSDNLTAAIAVRVSADGTQTVEQVYSVNSSGAIVAAPISLGAATDTVVLEIFGTGIRAAGTAGVAATAGGVSVPVQYAGAQGSFDGLDQVNIVLPQSLAGKGSVAIQLSANGIAANSTNVTIQ